MKGRNVLDNVHYQISTDGRIGRKIAGPPQRGDKSEKEGEERGDRRVEKGGERERDTERGEKVRD